MLDLNLIRTDPELVKAAVRSRQNPELAATVDAIIELDLRRRELLKEVETLKAASNQAQEAAANI